nr:hypothetical protein [Tanacetum cinerariifolium]
MADEITLESLTEEQFEFFIEYYHENYPEDFKSDLENLEEIYKMRNGGVEYPRTQNASPSEIKEPYEPSPRVYSYEKPSCLGSNFVELPKSQPKRTYNKDLECEIVMVKMPKCMAWLDDEPIGDLDTIEDKVDNLSPQCTPQVLPSFEVYTPPVTHPEEVKETIGIPMEDFLKKRKKFFFIDPRDGVRINRDGIARLYLMRRSLEVLRKFYWMILRGRFNRLSHVSFLLLSKLR